MEKSKKKKKGWLPTGDLYMYWTSPFEQRLTPSRTQGCSSFWFLDTHRERAHCSACLLEHPWNHTESAFFGSRIFYRSLIFYRSWSIFLQGVVKMGRDHHLCHFTFKVVIHRKFMCKWFQNHKGAAKRGTTKNMVFCETSNEKLKLKGKEGPSDGSKSTNRENFPLIQYPYPGLNLGRDDHQVKVFFLSYQASAHLNTRSRKGRPVWNKMWSEISKCLFR